MRDYILAFVRRCILGSASERFLKVKILYARFENIIIYYLGREKYDYSGL